MAHMRGNYRGPEREREPERARLELMSQGLNPLTQRWMHQFGISPGWHCLEVGAAEGSMSRWMADQTVPDGRVVAADIDTRFLDEMDHPGVEVRKLDIRSDELEKDRFDLAYCRTIMLHLEDHEAALAKMRDALKPGGLLFAQEPDLCLFEAADPDHPGAQLFSRFHRELYAALRRNQTMDTQLGRTLPRCFERLGLVDVECDATAQFIRGDSASSRATTILLRDRLGPPLIEAGALDAGEVERMLELYADPDFTYLSGLQVAVRGRRPA